MKKRAIALIALLALLCALLTACGGPTENDIIGVWVPESDVVLDAFEFDQYGVGVHGAHYAYEKKQFETTTGATVKWELNGDKLLVKVDNDSIEFSIEKNKSGGSPYVLSRKFGDTSMSWVKVR